ncbi:hypothetical protein [Kaistella jeonii]|uniref:Uncharacterized protein n=1 Tax=Kaistella jeonii TaxID=266749 RepID=A0A0C1FNU1_9FLAO|nr:hypothetical protein [Kaistella jeonii]KIA89549.1 hypothetical protein OA86_02625 [Kaistella jeonii]
MKKKLLNILMISSIFTTIGFIMDGDPKVPSIILRFTEFFLMLGIFFLVLSVLYFGSIFIKRSFRKVIN